LLAPLLVAFQNLVVGETCPPPEDVERRVRTILHLSPEQELSEGFIVERHEAGLYVELRSAESALIGQRTLPAEGSCDELGQAAAVVLSAWLSDVHPDFAGALPPAERPAPAPAPAPEPAPAAPPVPAPRAAPSPAPAVPSPPPPPSPPPSRRLELALAVGTDVSERGLAFAGFLVADYLPRARGLGVSALVAGIWPQRDQLGAGFVEWWRWPAGLGPTLRVSSRSVRWDVTAGPSVGWLHLDGSSFDRTSSHDGVEWGAFLDVRAASRGKRGGVLALIDARIFPAGSSASASGDGGPWFFPVPSFSVGLALGAWLAP